MEKTNVMRLLDRGKAVYKAHAYESGEAISGVQVAAALGVSQERIFKTLVTQGKSGGHFVFVIPAAKELNLKMAAAAASEKSIEMIKSKELLPLTGYIHGGCSPIGMKKFFPTFIDASALNLDAIIISAGRIGFQVEIALDELSKLIKYTLSELTDR